MNTILIVAGENSGEKYGADLVHQFKKIHPSIKFFGIGGEFMKREGVECVFSVQDLGLVGGLEVLSHMPRILKIFRKLKKLACEKSPLAAVLIDSPDFNLRLAKILKKYSIPVLYYVSPTIWAWRERRIRTIKKYIDKMMLIFPFEEKIYEENKLPATYVGHPLQDKVKPSLSKDEFFQKYGFDLQKKLIAILPGSRKSEIKYHMPVLMKSILLITEAFSVQFAFLLAENIDNHFFHGYIPPSFANTKILIHDHYDAMAFSDVVLSACGTANLESALLETPLISFYSISPITYKLGVKFIKIKNYSIVNILANKRFVPELIQDRFTPQNIFHEVKKIIAYSEIRLKMKQEFKKIKAQLGNKSASQNAAQELDRLIKPSLVAQKKVSNKI